jgi:hypothetical protein
LSSFWIALYPGVNYVKLNPSCLSLRRVLSKPTDGVVYEYLAHVGIEPRGRGNGGGLKGRFAACGIAVELYSSGTHGNNTDGDSAKKIEWFRFGGGTRHAQPQAQMKAAYLPKQEDLDHVLNGAVAKVSLDAVERHRGVPSQVLVRIHDGTGCGLTELGDDDGYAFAHFYTNCRDRDSFGTTSLTLKRKFLPGARDDLRFVLARTSRGGTSAKTCARRARSVEVFAKYSDAEFVATMKKITKRHAALAEAIGLMSSREGGFDDAESNYILTLVGTQQAYRELASTLRLKYKRTVLKPIDGIVHAVNSQLSPATHDHIIHEEVTVKQEVTVNEGIATKKKVTTRKKVKIVFWAVDRVDAELQLELNAIGSSFVKRFFGNRKNLVWWLFGGDKGGMPNSSFKFGAICLNQDSPLSALNLRMLAQVRGKDTREILKKTALTPEFASQISRLAKSQIVHVVSASKGGEATHGTMFVPEDLEIAVLPGSSDCPVYVEITNILSDVSRNACIGSNVTAIGVLAVHDGYIVGTALLEYDSELGLEWALVCASALHGRPLANWDTGEEAWTKEESGEGFIFESFVSFKLLALYVAAEPIEVRALVFVETLGQGRMLTGDHEFYATFFGQQGSTARCFCWACLVDKEGARRGLIGELRTDPSIREDATRFPTGLSRTTVRCVLSYLLVHLLVFLVILFPECFEKSPDSEPCRHAY